MQKNALNWLQNGAKVTAALVRLNMLSKDIKRQWIPIARVCVRSNHSEYLLGIELDPDNTSLWSALRAAEEGYEEDKKLRFAAAAQERAYEEELWRQKNEAKQKAAEAAEAEKNKKNEEDVLNDFLNSLPLEPEALPEEVPQEETKEDVLKEIVPEKVEDDLLEGFFSELNDAEKEKEKKKEAAENAKHNLSLTEKYTNQDLGTALDQYRRLTCRHYEFKNQNPYYVLQLDTDATMEDIKYRFLLATLTIYSFRYRKLSAKLHPDKMRDVENSRLAFEEVFHYIIVSHFISQLKDAYQKLCDDSQRNTIILNIDHVRSEVMKERRKLISKGVSIRVCLTSD